MDMIMFHLILLLSPALSKHLLRYGDLEEEDQLLFRAAYDTPNYDHEEEDDDLPLGKLDLLKDGMWAVKAKLKELKTFNKAFAANLLSTKLKLKELLENHMAPIKKHQHLETDKKKPTYNYQVPTYQYEHQYGQYPVPQYAPPPYGHDPYHGH